MSDWDTNQELSLRIAADFFKLRELRDALADTNKLAEVLMRTDFSLSDFHTITHAMHLQYTVISARLRLNVEAYRTLLDIKNGDDPL